MQSEAVENGDGGKKKVGGKLVITDEGTERGSDRRWGCGGKKGEKREKKAKEGESRGG